MTQPPNFPARDAAGRSLAADTSWNLLSLAVQVLAGAGLTIGVYFGFGSTSLGIFNQLYAIFVISGQLFVFGLNDSALTHSARYSDKPRQSDMMLETGLRLAFLGGGIGVAVIFAAAILGGETVLSAEVREGVAFLAPGIFLFVINKVLFGVLNGRRWFFRFALVQAVRALVLVASVFAVLGFDASPGLLGLCFTFTEAVVLAFNFDLVRDAWRIRSERCGDPDGFHSWIRTHLSFGMRAVPHGLLSETFIRLDILVLMLFVDDSAIGIYSFAAFFVEGVYQLPVVIRNITNPQLVPLFTARAGKLFRRLVIRSGGVSLILTASATAVILLAAPQVSRLITIQDFDSIYGILLIILPALTFYAFSIPFDFAILQAGRPGLQSMFMTATTLVNLVANLILIPSYGLQGAAIGTAIALFSSTLILWLVLICVIRIHTWPHDG